jgi:hypothetical protein
MGYAMAAILGAPTERVNSGIMESEMVEMPAASISLCTSPTDRQQNGQTGTSTAASTSSAFICSIMAGTLSSKSSRGSRTKPWKE